MVHTLQVTLTGAAQPITTNNIDAVSLTFQNNAAAVMRVGDSNVTASRGYSLAVNASFSPQTGAPNSATQLKDWYVIGTATQVLDVIYDDGGL